jgi:hypothetical protein
MRSDLFISVLLKYQLNRFHRELFVECQGILITYDDCRQRITICANSVHEIGWQNRVGPLVLRGNANRIVPNDR